jgi:hypothetical protein
MRNLSPATSVKLFATGAAIGPIVDSLHNQCLLRYYVAPISLEWPTALSGWNGYDYYFCSSWTVPPLLGLAYVVLGGILPRVFQSVLAKKTQPPQLQVATSPFSTDDSSNNSAAKLQKRALLAVGSTALIIKLSEFLEVYPHVTDDIFPFLEQSQAHLVIMIATVLLQWGLLDGTMVALIVASVTAIGGPLSELPFVAGGVWEYIDQAADYFPLHGVSNGLLQTLLGENYQSLALSSITGPCYFAVTTDAIALGRWFDVQTKENTENK